MSRLKNDELRKLRSTFDQFRCQIEQQMVNLVDENDKLRTENGQLRLKITQIERNSGFLSETMSRTRIRKNASASALLSTKNSSSEDDLSPGSPIKTLANRSRRRIDFSSSIQPITRLKRAYNDTSKTVSNIVTSTIRLGDIFLTENELPMIEVMGYHKDCITDIVSNEDICITASLDKTCRSWRQGWRIRKNR